MGFTAYVKTAIESQYVWKPKVKLVLKAEAAYRRDGNSAFMQANIATGSLTPEHTRKPKVY